MSLTNGKVSLYPVASSPVQKTARIVSACLYLIEFERMDAPRIYSNANFIGALS